jgi:hypothetical protein
MDPNRLSISVRLRRVRTETAHVSVPITEELLVPDETNPASRRVDIDKLIAAALEMGNTDAIDWTRENEEVVQLHPTQNVPTTN